MPLGSRVMSLALLTLCTGAALAQLPTQQLERYEKNIAKADKLRTRQPAVKRYIQAAADAPPLTTADLSAVERERVEKWQAEALAAGTTLVPYIGRYNVLLLPEDVTTALQRRQAMPLLDASYVLLRLLFAVDPVAERGYRVIHRWDAATSDIARTRASELICSYGQSELKDWAEPKSEWCGHAIEQLTRCFAENSSARRALESLPGASGGWPKWARLFVYAHVVDDKLLQDALERRTKECRSALRKRQTESRDFWSIPDGDAAAGLLLEIADSVVPGKPEEPDDPFAPFLKTFAALQKEPLPQLGEHPPLELLHFLTVLDENADPAFWRTLRRFGCSVMSSDAVAFRNWRRNIADSIAPDADVGDPQVATVRAWAAVAGRGSKYERILADQTLAMLAGRVLAAGHPAQARQLIEQRPLAITYQFLGPLDPQATPPAAAEEAASTGRDLVAVLDQMLLNETAATRDRLTYANPVRARWQLVDLQPDDLYDLTGLMTEQPGRVGYLWGTVRIERAAAHWLWVSAVDAARVYVNGERIRPDLLSPGTAPSRNVRTPLRVDLRRGENMILIKVVNQSGSPQVYTRLSPALDQP